MSNDREVTREQLTRARRLLDQAFDPVTEARLRIYIEQLERQMLLQMARGPE